MTARSFGISLRCSSTSSAGTRRAFGSFLSDSPHAVGFRVSTNVNCSPRSSRSLTSSVVILVASIVPPPSCESIHRLHRCDKQSASTVDKQFFFSEEASHALFVCFCGCGCVGDVDLRCAEDGFSGVYCRQSG